MVGVDGRPLGRGQAAQIVAAAVLNRRSPTRVGSVAGDPAQKARDACGRGMLRFEDGRVRLAAEARVDLWEIEDAWAALTASVGEDPPSVEHIEDALTRCRELRSSIDFAADLVPQLDDLTLGEYRTGYFVSRREQHAREQQKRLALAAGVAHALDDNEAKYDFAFELKTLEPGEGTPELFEALSGGTPILAAEVHSAVRAAVERRRELDNRTVRGRIDPRYLASVQRVVGRDEDLALLSDALDQGAGSEEEGSVVVVHGPVGVGKGAVADALARQKVDAGWALVRRFRAGARAPLSSQLPGFARDLGWPSPTPGADDQQLAAEWLRASLPQIGPWLLVVEDVAGPSALAPLLPCPPGGAMLVVTRNPNWHGIADCARAVEPHPSTAIEELFALWADVPVSDTVAAICAEYGYRAGYLRPLAEQVHRGARTPEELLEEIERGEGGAAGRIHHLLNSAERAPGVRTLLDVIAVLDREDIPLALLAGVSPDLPDLRLVRGAVTDLVEDSLLVRRERWATVISVNVIEHDIMRERLDSARRADAMIRAAQRLRALMPAWPVDARLGEHIDGLVRQADVLARMARDSRDELPLETRIEVAELLGKVAAYRRWRSDWQEAERDRRWAVELADDDPDRTGRARRALELGNLLRKRGKLGPQEEGPGAEALIATAVDELEASDADEVEVAKAHTIQARLYRVHGELHEALRVLTAARPVLEGAQGSGRVSDRELADVYGWFAGIYRRLGRREQAREAIELALDKTEVDVEQVLAQHFDRVPRSRSALKHLRTLGTIERAHGRVQVSLAIQNFVLDARIRALSPDHHLVAVSHVEVARDELTLGDLDAAAHHATEANRISVQRCGENYPHRGTAQVLLAIVDRERENYESARERLETAARVFDARKRADARNLVDHLDFAIDVGDCALLLAVERVRARIARDTSDLTVIRDAISEGHKEVQRTEKLREQKLGVDHPHLATCHSARAEISWLGREASRQALTAATLSGRGSGVPALEQCAADLGEDARTRQEAALHHRERTLEKADPNIAWTLERLATIAAELGDVETARDAWSRCAAIRSTALGVQNPLTRRAAARAERHTSRDRFRSAQTAP